jgi:hypothetical protein
MNRRHCTVMTMDDHHAAAREMATDHRSVVGLEHDHSKRFGVGRQTDPSAMRTGVQQ